ncbi:hypothetical protein OXIME_000968 [Oxyplasma meridianum]|uniref:Uncharacterized protein n=1 Tax=Oxyplasma meridianum TaxID=3073602 RepID=A0AAX4NHD1_9ARCH
MAYAENQYAENAKFFSFLTLGSLYTDIIIYITAYNNRKRRIDED